jgi:malonyl-CoA/methylmalonyl-CoA synthetase
MPEKTREELRSNGFFITGDLGTMDADGRISIVGREKDMIISGGYNIYPKEIEDVLNDIKGISESAVFGVAHPDFGEAVIAAVVLENQSLTADAIAVHIELLLANFKQPRQFIMLDALPRNTMGKVQKNVLRYEYAP